LYDLFVKTSADLFVKTNADLFVKTSADLFVKTSADEKIGENMTTITCPFRRRAYQQDLYQLFNFSFYQRKV